MIKEITKILKEADMEGHVRLDIYQKIFEVTKENDAKMEALEYFQVRHIGLWCIDKPEKIPEKLKEECFWEIKKW